MRGVCGFATNNAPLSGSHLIAYTPLNLNVSLFLISAALPLPSVCLMLFSCSAMLASNRWILCHYRNICGNVKLRVWQRSARRSESTDLLLAFCRFMYCFIMLKYLSVFLSLSLSVFGQTHNHTFIVSSKNKLAVFSCCVSEKWDVNILFTCEMRFKCSELRAYSKAVRFLFSSTHVKNKYTLKTEIMYCTRLNSSEPI